MLSRKSNRDISEIKEFTVSKEDVRRALLPELNLIKGNELKDKVVDAWRLACSLGGYKRVEDVPTESFEELPTVSNLDHQKGTARIASFMVKGLAELGVKLNHDEVVAAAICHDVGKPIEWRDNQRGFYSNAMGAGTFYGENPNMPKIEDGASYQIARHPVWGVYVAMQVGMPDHIIHMIAAHSLEGNLYIRTPGALVVKEADEIWWEQVAYGIVGTWPGSESPFMKGKVRKYRQMDWRRGAPRRKNTGM